MAVTRTVLLSKAAPDAPLNFGSAPVTTSTALGSGRTTAGLPVYNITLLRAACANPNKVPNPNHSTGCSPVLRALLQMSGLAYQVTREIFNDGQPNGHMGGNAIDVAGPTPGLPTDIVEICDYLSAVPTLFAAVIYYDPVAPLYIYDGQMADATAFGGDTSALVQGTIGTVHIQSSSGRLLSGLSDPATLAAIGVGPTYTPEGGDPISNTHIGPFGDRLVYVNSDHYTTGGTAAATGAQDSLHPKTVTWW